MWRLGYEMVAHMTHSAGPGKQHHDQVVSGAADMVLQIATVVIAAIEVAVS